MILRFLTLFMGSIFLLAFGFFPAAAGEISRPLTFSGPQFQIEDLRADLHSDGSILIVRGKIKNLSESCIQGFLTVYYKSAHHEILKTLETKVNDNQPIAAGQFAKFETISNVQNIPELSNVSVEFTETRRGLPQKKSLK